MTLARIGERLRSGLWFLPSMIVAASVGLAVLLPFVDRRYDVASITADPDTARQLLATVATATVTFAGLVFSITILALQLTSSQFSPRALRQFLRDRPNQLALGTFAGIFLYALLVLMRITSGDDAFVPSLAVDFALLAGATAVFTFIGFVAHIMQSIRVVRIIESVAAEARHTAAALARQDEDDPAPSEVLRSLAIVATVARHRPGGVLQHVDVDRLARVGARLDIVVRVVPETGDYVPEGATVVEAWGSPDQDVHLRWEDVDETLGFGPERTMTSDLAFGYRQLADIGAKALSPALNDPTTAVQCVDRLHDLLRVEATRPPIARVHRDDDGRVRVVHSAISWDELLGLAFDEIRIYGSNSLQVVRRIRAALEDLYVVAGPRGAAALDNQVGLLDRAIRRSFSDQVDREHAGIADEQGLGDDG